ncbi:hypothetical protein DCAR_0727275 [Daucus carota subsp. sativus]|nr:PREDICTED: BTB/POZ and TAZ domain-containing protein 3 [Daucus carota subsp. sativus]XP_017216174.1 PREDICTED: BTB/POZ and TAZ domain-containing protein 3 [Daucus carota subsp. sativus]WOH07841.1 hypothetical protein DCAR_0727275 [Daucus carota subsp. sativus]
MDSPDFDSPWSSLTFESLIKSLDVECEERNTGMGITFREKVTAPLCQSCSIPRPPPLPGKMQNKNNYLIKLPGRCLNFVPKETKQTWDDLFKQGYAADVCVVAENEAIIPAHFIVLNGASQVLGNFLIKSKFINGIKYIKIPGVPYGAVYAFIRFLYSSCYEVNEMKEYTLHLFVLSHCYAVPSLKRVCEQVLEQDYLIPEKVIDVLQLARKCDSSRLSFICTRMVVRDFKTISTTEGWKAMTLANSALEQELLGLVVEADSSKQERLKKVEEKKVYLQLVEAMEAVLHIFQDGCKTIGPRDKVLKGYEVACNFPACKGIETLVRHFLRCKTRVPGGCAQCKRTGQLLELHSRMCSDPDNCKVPLCRNIKEKMSRQSKKDETKWKLLVSKVVAAKNALGPFSPRQSIFI